MRLRSGKKNNNKQYGLAKERQVKHMLEADGWQAYRSRGSFSYFDILAMKPDIGWRLIQVKTTKQKHCSYIGLFEEMQKVPVPPNTTKEVWIWWSPRKDRAQKGWDVIIIQ